jgi:hypothetical protein
MNKQDKINKAGRALTSTVNETIITNLVSAQRSGAIDVTDDQLQKVLSLVSQSTEQGYHKGLKTFQSAVEKSED